MLVAVYHQSVPMWGSQQISMQMIIVDSSSQVKMLANVPVPIRPQSLLRSIHFSEEGMLLSQDTTGTMRAFSLERGDWTTVSLVGLEDPRKAWVIGFKNQEVIFWKTSNEDP